MYKIRYETVGWYSQKHSAELSGPAAYLRNSANIVALGIFIHCESKMATGSSRSEFWWAELQMKYS